MAAPATGRNLRSTFKRRRRDACPMAAYDRLPSDLRAWLADAALPWSAQSALRLWRKALAACNGDAAEARRQLGRIEGRQLCRDARRIWGEAHPAARDPASADP